MEASYYKDLLNEYKKEGFPPLACQYLALKAKHSNALLFFRVGEFYELWFEDALEVYKSIAIVLTKRKFKGIEIPMCGVPSFSYKSYVAKLVSMGYKVAMCNQIEGKNDTSGNIVTREVTQVITPGVVPYDFLLEDNSYNFVLIVSDENCKNKNSFYNLSWCDIATGDIFIEKVGKDLLLNSLSSIKPKEVIASKEVIKTIKENNFKAILTPINFNKEFDDLYNITSNNFKALNSTLLQNENFIFSVGNLLIYIKQMLGVCKFPLLKTPQLINNNSYLKIDSFTLKSLEVFKKNDGFAVNSLQDLLNNTLTNVGSKYLQSLILRPYGNHIAINERLEIIDFLLKNHSFMSLIAQKLPICKNIQRAISNILNGKYQFKDIIEIKNAIKSTHEVKILLYSLQNVPFLLQNLIKNLDFNNNLITLLEDAILDSPIEENDLTFFVKRGYNFALDKCCDFLLSSNDELYEILEYYKNLYSLGKVKLSKNTLYGYCLSISNKNISKITSNADLKCVQSLAYESRYKSQRINDLEAKIISNQILKSDIEKQIVGQLGEKIAENDSFLYFLVDFIAQIDVFYSLTTTSLTEGYLKPIVDNSNTFIVKDGYHATLKKSFNKQNKNIVVNNLSMKNEESFTHILTAPNMAGKSTYLRQNAIIILLAQIACYVPASYVHLGVCDAIYSRVGSYDEILKNRSTFMVEMEESAFILKYASNRSFIIFDEIGRGTSSKDGSAISQAIIEYIYNNVKCKVIFTTHYHDLIEKLKPLSNIKYFTIETTSKNGIEFLYKVVKGLSKQSYGIFVASLAGLPFSVVERAKHIANYSLKTSNKKREHVGKENN